jgi:prolyl-tRNA editing enzyme YbaK/EbsC (Cys-tRNA(Pro) deacylase)
MDNWPEPVRRVAGVLQESRVEARVEEFGEGTPTAEDAANAAGCPVEQIVKTLVFSCDKRADTGKVALVAGGERVKSVRPDAVEGLTGFPPGGVAPFPLPGIETVLIDRALLAHEVVWIGAGSHQHMAVLTPTDLVRLARARAADVTVE